MRCDRKLQRGSLLFIVAGLGIATLGTLAFADSVPESIRIQEKAEKAYEAKPVVPIERGNAHHRDTGTSEGDGAGTEAPQPALPAAKTDKHGTNK